MKSFAKFTHPIYKSSSGPKFDAIAWAFTSPKTIEKISFNFPEIQKDEIRANVLYCGLCHSDVLMSRSQWFKNLTYPIVPGHEIIAEVKSTGDNVKDFKRGDIVGFGFLRDCCEICDYCKRGKDNLCIDTSIDRAVFGKHFGGFATAIQQPSSFFYKLPQNIKLNTAGPLLCAGITVFAPIKNHLKKGDNTAVIGIGGLGHMAVQYLSKMGHRVTAFNNHLDYKDLIMKLGADNVVNTTDDQEFKKHLGKYNFIINTVPYGSVISKLIPLCAPGAKFIQVGLPDENDPLVVPHIPLVFNEVQLIGSIVGSREDNKSMLDFSSNNNIYPICEEYEFEDFLKAVDKIENGKPKFRIVINIVDYAKRNNLV